MIRRRIPIERVYSTNVIIFEARNYWLEQEYKKGYTASTFAGSVPDENIPLQFH